MFLTSVHIVEIIIVCVSLAIGYVLLHKKIGKRFYPIFALIVIWLGVFSYFLAGECTTLTEKLTITALRQNNGKTQGAQVHVDSFTVDGENLSLPRPIVGKWAWYKKSEKSEEFYCSWFPVDPRHPSDATDSITFELPVGYNRAVNIKATPMSGLAQIELNTQKEIIDTWGENQLIAMKLVDSTPEMITKNQLRRLPYFTVIFGVLFISFILLVYYILSGYRINKIQKNQFLFGELVKRDFTTKYKRTMLGMLWSILSPLFNLLIMWLVFNNILGNTVNHFVIYLFSGQVIFSFFSEASSQGMTSLLLNANIFTKVNVPKYLFLLSKNISSLINFGLNLMIFFIFVAVEGIPFTEKYLMLIYPIGCLIVFNIGLGLILSAMYVFFRDMQYLWGLLTQLIMWVSAIFYSIKSFTITAQNLFLLNPVYLFIRYFRKIVLEASVPSIWFHVLMMGYSLVFLWLGSRMYKKYNHEFLYYI